MRAALYARVSTHDQQTLGVQVEATAVYIKGRGWDLVRQVNDVGSGARERPGREGLLKAAGRREIRMSDTLQTSTPRARPRGKRWAAIISTAPRPQPMSSRRSSPLSSSRSRRSAQTANLPARVKWT
jgi:Resolvase, N terminal domain